MTGPPARSGRRHNVGADHLAGGRGAHHGQARGVHVQQRSVRCDDLDALRSSLYNCAELFAGFQLRRFLRAVTSTSALMLPVILPSASRRTAGRGQTKNGCRPDAQQYTRRRWGGSPPFRTTAIGHWSCGSGVPSGRKIFQVTHQWSGADFRRAARQGDGSGVEIGETAVSVSGVDGDGQCLDHLPKSA